MTICIAVVCDNGSRVVVAADRMFTASPPLNLEFETEERKIENLAKSCVALTSGSAGFATEVLNEARAKLAGSQIPLIADVAELINGAYTNVRAKKAAETIVTPALGSDFSDFV